MAYVSHPSVFYYKSKWQDNALRADIQIIYQMNESEQKVVFLDEKVMPFPANK